MSEARPVLVQAAMPPRRFLHPGLRWPLVLVLWLVPGLLSASQFYLLAPSDISFLSAVVWQVPGWLYWAAATPLILLLARRFPLERQTWPRSVAVHLLAAIALSAGHLAFLFWWGSVNAVPFYLKPLHEVIGKLVTKHSHLELVTYMGVVATAHAFAYYRQFRERAVAAAQLEARLAQAQLEALKIQLHPHFLFNTLHTIAVLVRKGDTHGSVRMIAGLSDLLRIALDGVRREMVPLEQELGFATRYLDIEKVRFQDRLSVKTDIAPETLVAQVPNLLLQPLVENAIRHGVGRRAEAGIIELRARRAGDRLVITVRDDGPGPVEGWQPGLGLGNARARLEQLFPDAHRLELASDERGGAVLTLEIPFKHD